MSSIKHEHPDFPNVSMELGVLNSDFERQLSAPMLTMRPSGLESADGLRERFDHWLKSRQEFNLDLTLLRDMQSAAMNARFRALMEPNAQTYGKTQRYCSRKHIDPNRGRQSLKTVVRDHFYPLLPNQVKIKTPMSEVSLTVIRVLLPQWVSVLDFDGDVAGVTQSYFSSKHL